MYRLCQVRLNFRCDHETQHRPFDGTGGINALLARDSRHAFLGDGDTSDIGRNQTGITLQLYVRLATCHGHVLSQPHCVVKPTRQTFLQACPARPALFSLGNVAGVKTRFNVALTVTPVSIKITLSDVVV